MGVVDTGNPFKDFLQMLCSDDIKVSEEEIGRSWIAVQGAARRRLRRVRILTFATVASVAAAVAALRTITNAVAVNAKSSPKTKKIRLKGLNV